MSIWYFKISVFTFIKLFARLSKDSSNKFMYCDDHRMSNFLLTYLPIVFLKLSKNDNCWHILALLLIDILIFLISESNRMPNVSFQMYSTLFWHIFTLWLGYFLTFRGFLLNNFRFLSSFLLMYLNFRGGYLKTKDSFGHQMPNFFFTFIWRFFVGSCQRKRMTAFDTLKLLIIDVFYVISFDIFDFLSRLFDSLKLFKYSFDIFQRSSSSNGRLKIEDSFSIKFE